MARSVQSGPTVLCIDDNVPGLNIRRFFLEVNGFQVLVAESGEKALTILRASNVNAIVVDYRMPHMDGMEVARRVRATWPYIPIIMLTGFVAERQRAWTTWWTQC